MGRLVDHLKTGPIVQGNRRMTPKACHHSPKLKGHIGQINFKGGASAAKYPFTLQALILQILASSPSPAFGEVQAMVAALSESTGGKSWQCPQY